MSMMNVCKPLTTTVNILNLMDTNKRVKAEMSQYLNAAMAATSSDDDKAKINNIYSIHPCYRGILH